MEKHVLQAAIYQVFINITHVLQVAIYQFFVYITHAPHSKPMANSRSSRVITCLLFIYIRHTPSHDTTHSPLKFRRIFFLWNDAIADHPIVTACASGGRSKSERWRLCCEWANVSGCCSRCLGWCRRTPLHPSTMQELPTNLGVG